MSTSDLPRVGERHPPGVTHGVIYVQKGQHSTATETRLVQRVAAQSMDVPMGHILAQGRGHVATVVLMPSS